MSVCLASRCGHYVFPVSVLNFFTLPGCQAYLSSLFTELVCPDCSMYHLSTLLVQLWFAQLAKPALSAQFFVMDCLCSLVAQLPSPACLPSLFVQLGLFAQLASCFVCPRWAPEGWNISPVPRALEIVPRAAATVPSALASRPRAPLTVKRSAVAMHRTPSCNAESTCQCAQEIFYGAQRTCDSAKSIYHCAPGTLPL